jgi:hypothetical protein
VKQISILTALNDPNLLGGPGSLNGSSWQPWHVALKALFALPLDQNELELYQQCTGRQKPPIQPFKEAAFICGRRAGKTRTMALLAVFLATLRDWRPHLALGESAIIAIVSCDRQQSQVALSYIKGFLRNKPLLAELIESDLATVVRLSNGTAIEIHTARISSPRGRTFACVLCDEIAFWRSDESAHPDIEVLNAIRPGLATLPNSLMIMASNPYSRRGVLWDVYRRYYGTDDSRTLVWKAATLVMNPSLDPRIVEQAYTDDPLYASAEFGAEFRTDVDAFISREVVDRCVAMGCKELYPTHGIRYAAFVDPSGGSGDSFTLAIGHATSGRGVLDLIRERVPPFSPQEVVREFAKDLARYKINRISGDKYGGEWPSEEFKKYGITYEASERTKSELYVEVLPLINSQKVTLLDHSRLISQFCGLERRTSRAGRDSIDHAPGSHDDICNAVSGVLVAVAGKTPNVEAWLRYGAAAHVLNQQLAQQLGVWAPVPLRRRGRAA